MKNKNAQNNDNSKETHVPYETLCAFQNEMKN